MSSIDPDFAYDYAMQHTQVTPLEVLNKLERRTHLEVLMPQMLSGPLQGQFFALLTRLLKPKRILEVGTFTGYSALCWAEGLSEGGKVHTLEINEELASMAQAAWQEAGVADRIELHLGPALETLAQFEDESFDLAFVDADKANYPVYYEEVLKLLKPGGLMLLDNVLWHGNILSTSDKRARTLHALNQHITQDTRVKNLLLPLRDGLMLVEKL